MPACEKCWADAARYSYESGRDRVDIYRDLVEERDCTPEEQCGDMHLVLSWKDGRPDQCRCGKVVKPGSLCRRCGWADPGPGNDLCAACMAKELSDG